jgi:hypothetical protein
LKDAGRDKFLESEARNSCLRDLLADQVLWQARAASRRQVKFETRSKYGGKERKVPVFGRFQNDRFGFVLDFDIRISNFSVVFGGKE